MNPILYIDIDGEKYSCGPEVAQSLGQSAAAAVSQKTATDTFKSLTDVIGQEITFEDGKYIQANAIISNHDYFALTYPIKVIPSSKVTVTSYVGDSAAVGFFSGGTLIGASKLTDTATITLCTKELSLPANCDNIRVSVYKNNKADVRIIFSDIIKYLIAQAKSEDTPEEKIDIVQSAGDSTTAVMSQNAVTELHTQMQEDITKAGISVNIFDGKFQFGYYSSADASFVDPQGGKNESCTVNSIPCAEGDNLRIRFPNKMDSARILICDASNSLIYTQLFLAPEEVSVTAPANAAYLLFNVTHGTGNVSKIFGTTVVKNFVNIRDQIGGLSYQLTCLIGAAQQTQTVNRLLQLRNASILILKDISKNAKILLTGKNLLNIDSRKATTIKNDSGDEVYDYNSFYYTDYIPVIPGESLYLNFGAQRVYEYDVNRLWLRRTGAYHTNKTFGVYTVPLDCYFIQVQANGFSVKLDQAQVERGTKDTGYIEATHFSRQFDADETNILLPSYGAITTVYVEEGATATIKSDATQSAGGVEYTANLPACIKYPLWEPSFTTDEYTVPIGRNNVSLDLTYYDFLSLYFDKYLGNHEDLVFTKYSLGTDSSSFYDVITYDIIPKNYNRTVLISAGMNTCELSPMWGLAFFIKAIMEQYEEDTGLKYLRENVRFKIIPVLCPWSFDQSPMQYTNSNGVRINKNFNYKNSWTLMETSDANTRGTLPDSEAETRILKKWINDNANEASLWIDAHCDPDNNTPYLNTVFCSNTELTPICDAVQVAIRTYYVNKGTASPSEPVGSSTARINIYPKTLYSKAICNVNAIMIEQYPVGTAHGGDGTLANDDADIRNYVLMLRAYTLALLERDAEDFNVTNAGMLNYQTLLEAKKIIN